MSNEVPEFLYALRVKGTDDIYLKLTEEQGLHDASGQLGVLGVAKEEDVGKMLRSIGIYEQAIGRYEVVKIRSMNIATRISLRV